MKKIFLYLFTLSLFIQLKSGLLSNQTAVKAYCIHHVLYFHLNRMRTLHGTYIKTKDCACSVWWEETGELQPCEGSTVQHFTKYISKHTVLPGISCPQYTTSWTFNSICSIVHKKMWWMYTAGCRISFCWNVRNFEKILIQQWLKGKNLYLVAQTVCTSSLPPSERSCMTVNGSSRVRAHV